MNRLLGVFSLVLLLLQACSSNQSSTHKTDQKNSQDAASAKKGRPEKYETKTQTEDGYTYKTVEGDPSGTRIYTLDNGLKVYLSVYENEPRIQTYVTVRAGSKYDPARATGLAHYLEHILFKGTSKIGAANWQKEKPLLKEIERLYQVRRQTQDPAKRQQLYQQIDSVSQEAAKLVYANEYDKLVGSIGASKTNAHTSVEETVYKNEIPANSLEQWIRIEAERFSQVVPRLFHTELEAVYEEKNISLDKDGTRLREKGLDMLYPKHNYGQQTTIGTVEHLKNPSITEIKQYFEQYYVPNNMAICLSGDLNPTETIKLIDQHFGDYQRQPVPEYKAPETQPLESPKSASITGPEQESVSIFFRTPAKNTRDALKARMVDAILANGKAGLIDLHLNQDQQVQGAYSHLWQKNEFGTHFLGGSPKSDQDLEEVKDLLLAELDKVKQGDFPNWLPEAIVNNARLSLMKKLESNQSRAKMMVDAFIGGMSWEDKINQIDRMATLSKKEIVRFAKENYQDNYVVVYKKKGEKNTQQVEKPDITPVEMNREENSDFYKRITNMEREKIEPVFLDFQKAVEETQLSNGQKIYYHPNEENGLFNLYYVFDVGTRNDPKLGLAFDYLDYIGGAGYSAAELKQEFYKLGCNFGVSNKEEKSYVHLSGLQEKMKPALKLFEAFLANPNPDTSALNKLVGRKLKARKNAKLNKQTIFRRAISYAQYGKESPAKNFVPQKELQKMRAEKLTEIIKSFSDYQHRVLYYGPQKLGPLKQLLEAEHRMAKNPKHIPEAKQYKQREIPEKAFFVNYDGMVQAQALLITRSSRFGRKLIPATKLYNKYFGMGMGSILFQEIRESRALAYSVFGRYSTASDPERYNYNIAFVGTQADKLPDAIPALRDLYRNMPRSESKFKTARKSMLNKIRTNRITKKDVLFHYEYARKFGFKEDPRKQTFQFAKKATLNHMVGFQDDYINRFPTGLVVIGDQERISEDILREMTKSGEVKQLSLKEVFGY